MRAAVAAAARARELAAAAAAVQATQAALALRCGCLAALSALARQSEVERQAIAGNGGSAGSGTSGGGNRALACIAACLADESPEVAHAAASCLRSLGRSTRLLRCGTLPAQQLTAPLLALLRGERGEQAQV